MQRQLPEICMSVRSRSLTVREGEGAPVRPLSARWSRSLEVRLASDGREPPPTGGY